MTTSTSPEIRAIYHTTTVAQRAKLDVYDNGTYHKSNIVTNDPTYFPHNRSIEIAVSMFMLLTTTLPTCCLAVGFDMTPRSDPLRDMGV